MSQTREDKLAYQRRWHKAHPEKQKEYEAHRDKAKRREWGKEYRIKHRDLFNERAKIARPIRYKQARQAIIDALGNKCETCGFTDTRVLEIHHKHGGGNKERRNKTGALVNDYMYYRQMLTHTQDYVLLCSNCHSILRWSIK